MGSLTQFECWFGDVSAAALCVHLPRAFVYVGVRERACARMYSCMYVRLSGTEARPPLEQHALMDVNVD